MKYIGAHVSAANGIANAPLNAKALGAKAFAFNLVNPQRWRSAELTDDEVAEFKANCDKSGYTADVIMPHAAYLINPGAPDSYKLHLSRTALTDEMKRCQRLGLKMINFHPGAHLGQISEQECIARIAATINKALEATEGVTAVIENTAGQGSCLGYRFEQIAAMIDLVEDKSRVGVCVDTCHAFAAGYDLSTAEGYDACWREFDATIGGGMLRGMHVNDSMRAVASRIDRHATLGNGAIGRGLFERMMSDKRLDGIPLILETPDPTGWAAEIEWLYDLEQNR